MPPATNAIVDTPSGVRPLLEQFLRRAVKRKVRTDGDAGAKGWRTKVHPSTA